MVAIQAKEQQLKQKMMELQQRFQTVQKREDELAAAESKTRLYQLGDDPMQIDARLADLKNTLDKPRINFRMDMFDPKDKDEVRRDVDHFLTWYEYYCTANNLSTDALKINFIPVYKCAYFSGFH